MNMPITQPVWTFARKGYGHGFRNYKYSYGYGEYGYNDSSGYGYAYSRYDVYGDGYGNYGDSHGYGYGNYGYGHGYKKNFGSGEGQKIPRELL